MAFVELLGQGKFDTRQKKYLIDEGLKVGEATLLFGMALYARNGVFDHKYVSISADRLSFPPHPLAFRFYSRECSLILYVWFLILVSPMSIIHVCLFTVLFLSLFCIPVDENRINLSQGSELELGFTFSYPVLQKSINSGTLITWTKGFQAEGLVGNDPAAFLQNAFTRRGVPIRVGKESAFIVILLFVRWKDTAELVY